MANYIAYTMAMVFAFMVCLVSAQNNNDQIGNLAWPLAFKKTCGVAQSTNQDLMTIIREYDSQGFQCSQDAWQAFNVKDPCESINIIEGILWPIEFQKLQDMFRKLYAGVDCIVELMTGQKFD